MSTAPAANNNLHLPDLTISGFRGIEELSISRLGRVTLIAGKNGAGKTTLLDAVRIYAARGRYPVLADILRERGELTEAVDEDGDEILTPNWETLFYGRYDGRYDSSDSRISIGPGSEIQHLSIEAALANEEGIMHQTSLFPGYFSREDVQVLKIEFQGKKQAIPIASLSDLPSSSQTMRRRRSPLWNRRLLRNDGAELPSEICCESLGPGLLSNADMARFWDKVALTDDEARAVQALQLIYVDSVQRVAMIGEDRRSSYGRRAVVKTKGQPQPVPLHSLGDGAVRLFGVALALANSQGGFLVIDEAENGIHHSVQRDFWKMVLKTAYENNVQVLATTHGWDCVVGFAQAATDLNEVDGVLIRIERGADGLHAIEYSERDLKIAAEQGIEVR